jgi:ABC-type multidrug transport system fused ATPase/permease subunit
MFFLSRLWKLIIKDNKFLLIIIFFLSNIVSFLEFLTLGSIVPLISYILEKKELIFANNFFNIIFRNIAISKSENQFLFVIFLFSLLVFLSTVFRIFFIILTNIYSRNLGKYIGTQILRKTIFLPYSKIIRKNNTDILSLIISKTENVSYFVYNLIIFLNSLIILLVIFLSLVIITPIYSTLILIVLAFTYYFITLLTKKNLIRYGDDISKYISLKYKIVSECFLTIREVILHNGFKFFINKFIEVDKKYRKAQMYVGVISSVPKIIIEFFGILALSFLAYYLVAKVNFDSKTIISYLAVISFALYRILPLINNVYVSYTQIITLKQTVNDVMYSLDEEFPNKLSSTVKKLVLNTIIFNNVSYKYENSKNFILKNININIKKGLIYGIYGNTGVGKSTFLDLLTGLKQPSEGNILVNKKPLFKHEVNRTWQNSLSVVSQNIYLLDDSIKNNVAFISMNKTINMNKMYKICKDALIIEFIKKLPKKFDEQIGENGIKLSGGQKQRIGIARALWINNDILIFDEATNALDFETEKLIFQKLKKMKKTVFVVTHRLSTLKYCDKILKINKGLIYEKK